VLTKAWLPGTEKAGNAHRYLDSALA